MSNSPSPPRTPHHGPASSNSNQQLSSSAASRSSPAPMSTLAIAVTSPASPFYDPVRRPYATDRIHAGHAYHMPAAHHTEQGSRSLAGHPSQYTTSHPIAQSTPQTASQPSTSASNATPSMSSRGGRKSKAHVASACINCKRAHLSCDVSRPCARCVSAGKQDTCVDVQHKKRGRPRLREEGEYKAEQMMSHARLSSAIATGPDTLSRPIAVPRHRRTESFRSICSQGSEGPGFVPSPPYAMQRPQPTLQPAYGFNPASGPGTPGYEVPTAYLDLDLVVIKANGPFRQIMNGGQDARGRQLSDIAAPIDGESFHNLRNRLRAEREKREPVYMPPIMMQGHDPLLGASEQDVERYTRGFEDRTYTWHRAHGGSGEQPFPARVRLGKANAYFVAVTLPSFRPVETPPQPQSQPIPPPFPRYPSEPYAMRASTIEPLPRAGFVPYIEPSNAPPRQTSQESRSAPQTAPRSYPPQQPQIPLHHHQAPQASTYRPYQAAQSGTPRLLSIAEPPTETTAFTPRSTSRDLPPVNALAPGVQLPPIMGSRTPLQSPYTAAGPSTARPMPALLQRHSSSEDDSRQEAPNKRRKMDIGDVLHR